MQNILNREYVYIVEYKFLVLFYSPLKYRSKENNWEPFSFGLYILCISLCFRTFSLLIIPNVFFLVGCSVKEEEEADVYDRINKFVSIVVPRLLRSGLSSPAYYYYLFAIHSIFRYTMVLSYS